MKSQEHELTLSHLKRERERKSLSWRRILGLSLVLSVGILFVVTSVEAQTQEPMCNGQSQPPAGPNCGTPGVSCSQSNGCPDPSSQGNNYTYCCTQSGDNCTEVIGYKVCCDGVWIDRCEVLAGGADHDCSTLDGHCY